MENSKTKEKIILSAIVLFSDRGYDNVSMRDIAAEVGIKASSIYNHFPSKRDILKSIYSFYNDKHSSLFINMEEPLRWLEKKSFHDVFKKINFSWPPEIQDTLERVILIAGQRMCLDKESEEFISESFFKPQKELLVPLIKRAIKLGKIEPINIDIFMRLVMFYNLSCTGLNRTVMNLNMEQWKGGYNMLMSLLKPVKKNKR